MAEVTAIINARPLIAVSTDPDSPFILTPAMLLTQKVGAPAPSGDFTNQRPLQESLETDPEPRHYILVAVKSRVSPHHTEPKEAEGIQSQPPGRRSRPPKGQASFT